MNICKKKCRLFYKHSGSLWIVFFLAVFIIFSANISAISGSFTYQIDDNIVTLSPTLTDCTYYKWAVENGVDGETRWIDANDATDYIYVLGYDENYKFTLYYKNETTNGSYYKFFSISNDTVPILGVTEIPESDTKNFFDETGIRQWFGDRTVTEVLFAICILIFAMYVWHKKKK